jgi:hypothetical protein
MSACDEWTTQHEDNMQCRELCTCDVCKLLLLLPLLL